MAQTFTFNAAPGDAVGWVYDFISGTLRPAPTAFPVTESGTLQILNATDPDEIIHQDSIDVDDYRLNGDIVIRREGTATPVLGLPLLYDVSYTDTVDTSASKLTSIVPTDASGDHFTVNFGGEVTYSQIGGKTLGQMVKHGDTIMGSAFADTLKTTNMQEIVRGGDGNDNIDARGGNDQVFGGNGNDTLNGGSGADKVHGEAGNDLVYGLDGNDTMTGGTGNDRLYGGVGNDVIGGDGGDDRIYGEAGNDIVVGNAGNDFVDGGAGNDKMAGDAGNDIMFGQAGNDELYGGTGNDTLDGGAGNDGLDGGAGNDKIYGQAGNDILVGGTGNDILHGGNQNDILNGGLGNDTLTGGLDRDIFVFNVRPGAANRDIIVDFNSVNDTIALDNAIFTKIGANGALKASAFKLSTQTRDADDRIIYNKATGALFYDPDGSGAAAALEIAILKNKATISASDFVVI